MEITKKQLLEMEINSMISSSESIQFTIHRVIGGWNGLLPTSTEWSEYLGQSSVLLYQIP